MDLIRLIYCSRPFGFDNAILNGILSDARRCNERDAITGALICRADVYLQLIEAPRQLWTQHLRALRKTTGTLSCISFLASQ
jgi:Sensors of blue-light using FAD